MYGPRDKDTCGVARVLDDKTGNLRPYLDVENGFQLHALTNTRSLTNALPLERWTVLYDG